MVLALPLVVWWAIGDLSTTAVPDPDYMLEAPDVAPWVEATTGLTALLVVVGAVVVLVVTSRSRPLDRGWWLVLMALCSAGAITAAGGRVMTAGVIGANIGGGMFILFGVPVVLALLAVAAVKSWWMLRHR